MPAGDLTWCWRRDYMWHFYLATLPKPRYAELKEILNGYADNLATAIDRHPQVRPACLACEAGGQTTSTAASQVVANGG